MIDARVMKITNRPLVLGMFSLHACTYRDMSVMINRKPTRHPSDRAKTWLFILVS